MESAKRLAACVVRIGVREAGYGRLTLGVSMLIAGYLAAVSAVWQSGGPVAAAQRDGCQRDKAVRVLVAYYTLSGNTERLAEAVAEGARRVAGV